MESICLSSYYPRNDRYHDDHLGTQKLLDAKYGVIDIEYYVELTREVSGQSFFKDLDVISVVPSSDQYDFNTNVYMFALELGHEFGIPVSLSLVREISKPRSNQLGGRGFDINYATISVADNVRGKRVLIIDDVETSGSTFNACRKLLNDAGAIEVKTLALAKTRRSM